MTTPPPEKPADFTASDILSADAWTGRAQKPVLGIDVVCTKIAVDFQNMRRESLDECVRRNLELLRGATGSDCAFLVAVTLVARRFLPRAPEALAELLRPLVADADLLVAAASGNPALDAVEASAVAAALGGRRTPVTSIRGAIGDFGAAGALAAAAAALAVDAGLVPPTLGLVPPARAELDVVVGLARRTAVRVAVVDGLARGGLCCPLRLEAA